MGLIKEVMTKYDVPASYWKVGMFTIDTNLQEVNFTLNLYFKKGAKEFIDSYCISDLMGTEDKTMYNVYFAQDRGRTYKDWQTACYRYIKEQMPFFNDAIDDD